ncbi:DNRLRE domain-containing protein [bacterium]|nr:DNRLRE domain-containing protein [bacterium]
MKKSAWILAWLLAVPAAFSQFIIADHTRIDIDQIPVTAVQAAKEQLHIGYGYTSHGSQITGGMSGLVDFMNAKGYAHDLFAYDQDGAGGSLHLTSGDGYGDGQLDHDAGYYPNWVEETRSFLGVPNAQGRGTAHPEFNVIMWAWCGQLSGYSTADVYNQYLNDMNQLEQDYPGVTFVYMTGHADGSGLTGDLHRNNQTIRNYCIQNGKVLFDFYDIECYDPDGNYFGDRHVDDACNYDGGNWAQEWQNAHAVDVDWFYCDAAHTEPVNGNMKAYAVWWLWARLAGWAGAEPDPTPPSTPAGLHADAVSETQVDLSWNPSTDAESGVARYRIFRDGGFLASTSAVSYSDLTCIPGETYEYRVSAVNGAGTESDRSAPVTATLPSDDQPPSTPEGLAANPVSSTQIDLSWDPSTDNSSVSGYRVYRDGAFEAVTSETEYADTGLSPMTGYEYRVSAVDAAGNESGLSDPASATTLDPNLTPETVRLENTDEVDDTFIFADDPSSNFGGEQYFGDIDRFLIRFNLPAGLNGKRILSADLGFYVWNQSDFHSDEFLDIFTLSRSWSEYEATWLNASDGVPWISPGGDADLYAPIARISHLPDAADWDHTFYPAADITSLVQGWVDGETPNHGLLVMNSGSTGIGFKASEYGEGSRPFLEIEYTDKTIPGSVESRPGESFRLAGNWPNPFNPGTFIRFELDAAADVEIRVFDLRGREVQTLRAGRLGRGEHRVHFSADGLVSGVYLYSVQAGGQKRLGKMLLAR